MQEQRNDFTEPDEMAKSAELEFEKIPAGDVWAGDWIRFGRRDLALWAVVQYRIERGPKTVEFVLRSASPGVSLGAFGEHRQTCRKSTILGVIRKGRL